MTAFYMEGRDFITERSRPVQFEGFNTLEPVLPGLLVPAFFFRNNNEARGGGERNIG
jgi:hypothetical protein